MTADPEFVAAIGSMLRSDPRRALAVADSLRAPDRSIESTVSGWSMAPGLSPGARIRIALAPHTRYEAGVVVAYLAEEQLIVHRVVHSGRAGAARRHLIARGDAALVPDPPVEQVRVLGPVTAVRSAGNWLPIAAPPRRSPAVALARSLLSALAVAGLYVSPAATARLLAALYRAAAALRAARVPERHGQP